MQINKNIKYIFSILIFAAIIIAYVLVDIKKEYKINDASDKAQIPNILKKYKKEIAKIEKLEKTNPIKAKQKTSELINILPKKLKHHFSVGFNSNDEIQFYGQVIDQYQQPVVGAKVLYSVSGRYLSRGSGEGIAETDVNGDFIINGNGGLLTVKQIYHPDIDFHHDPYEGAGTGEGSHRSRKARLTFRGHINKIEGSLSYEHVSKEEPYIFKAWRISKGERKHNKNVKRGHLSDGMYADGRIYTVDLSKRRLQIKEGIHKGHLRMSCKRKILKNKIERRDKSDWFFSIEPIDGGIQSAGRDYYLNEAPFNNYNNKLVIQQNAISKEYLHGVRNKRYYFTAHNNKTYGSILFSFIPFAEKEYCFIKMELYKYTTDGTRNLVSIPKH